METEGTKGPTTGAGEPTRPPRKSSYKTKWIAIAVVVIVVVSAVAVVLMEGNHSTSPASPSVTSAPTTTTVGATYALSINANAKYSNATVFFGDGKSMTVSGGNSTTINATHVYTNPGYYYLWYTVKYSSGKTYTSTSNLIPLQVGLPSLGDNSSLSYIAASSSNASQVKSGSNIYAPGDSVSFFLSYGVEPLNISYMVYKQYLTVSHAGLDGVYSTVATKLVPYQWSSANGAYQALPKNSYYNNSKLSEGMYMLSLSTVTAVVNSTGGIQSGTTHNVTVVYDIPVVTSAGIYQKSAAGSFTTNELETGGFKTLDPAVAYDTVSYEILLNTLQYLVGYQGSSNSSFYPMLATSLATPNTANVTHTITVYNATTNKHNNVNATYGPGQVYTFTIRSNATFQDGTSVTSWDVWFSFARDLMFDAGSPGTPGWILAQVLLPGNFFASNDFYNITNNMTWSNSSNSITFYLQSPLSPTAFYELLYSSGDFVMSAKWATAHGAGFMVNFKNPKASQKAFLAYQAQGSATGYNTYIQYHMLANGPFMIDYTVTDSQVVLKANPNFSPPAAYNGKEWDPRPSIETVNIQYIGEPSTVYLNLKSGAAQAGGIPSSQWSEAQSLKAAGTINLFAFPTLSIFWYNFNANVNLSMLKTSSSQPNANLPSTLFTDLNARNAFAYAYNYAYYLAQQVGNAKYNTTFAYSYAGMLPAGMAYSQTISDLNKVTNGVPTFDLTKAKQYWNAFLNGNANKVFGITSSGDYKGAPLNIPIFIFSADPVDQAGATSWAQNLSQMIFGTSNDYGNFPVLPTPFTTLLGNMVQGNNPMPIYELGWAPDYPFPTDYLAPMALPTNSSTYPGPNDFTPYWFNGNSSNPTPNAAEASNMTSMISDYAIASTSLNQSTQIKYFHAMNEMLVNMTFYVYIEQSSAFWIISTKITPSDITGYQMNVMAGGGGDLQYNHLSYL